MFQADTWILTLKVNLIYCTIKKVKNKSMLFVNYNRTRTHNHLVPKQTLNHLTKLVTWLCVHLRTKWFESCCRHLNFRYHTCFKQGVSWHSGNYRVWIHSGMHTWHDKNIQSMVFIIIDFFLPAEDLFKGYHHIYFFILLTN